MRYLLLLAICCMCFSLAALTVFEAIQARDIITLNSLLKENPTLIDSQDAIGNTLLHLALRDTIPELVTVILSHNPRLDIHNNAGFFAIHLAAQGQPVGVLHQLQKAGANISSPDTRMGGSALLWASAGGNLEVISYLVSQGLDPNEMSTSTWKPVDMAVSRGHLDALKHLLALGATFPTLNDPDDYFFFAALNSGNTDLVSYIIDKGFDPNFRSRIGDIAVNQTIWSNQPAMLSLLIQKGARINDVFDRYNFAPLHVAAFQGLQGMCQILLDNGAVIDIPKPDDGTTPLQIAIESKKNELAKFLISKGAELEHLDKSGNTPFNSAVIWENNEMAYFLLDKNVDYLGANCIATASCPNPANPPIHNAALRNPEMLRVLLDKGVDINTTNNDGDTALISSVWGDSLACMQLLISRGADLNKQNKRGISALLMACQNQNSSKAELLIKAGCNISQTDFSGMSALHKAAINGDMALILLLMENGIQINAKDSAKLTALDYAMRYARNDAVVVLQDKAAKSKFKQAAKAQDKIDFASRQIGVWYLGHSGMAVRSGNNLLIFDYWKQQTSTANPSLYNGWVVPEDIADLNVYVFVSHSDEDHYDRRIFDWQPRIPNLKYVFGFRPELTPQYRQNNYPLPEYYFVPKDSSLVIDALHIKTLSSPIDNGSGFYVELNGLKIFHSGDAVNNSKLLPSDFSRSVDHLADQISGLDFAFLPMQGCGMNDVESLNLGTDYFIRMLKPQLLIPMHAGGSEYKYEEWKKSLKSRGGKTKTMIFHYPGDHFSIVQK